MFLILASFAIPAYQYISLRAREAVGWLRPSLLAVCDLKKRLDLSASGHPKPTRSKTIPSGDRRPHKPGVCASWPQNISFRPP